MTNGLAARLAAWQRRAAGLPSSSSLGGNSEADLSPKVELFLSEQWVDVSDDIRYSDGVSITRGRSDESRETSASTCKFTLDNAFGKYSPRNPLSPYYGVIGRNTPCRASILQNGIRRYRFYGEVSVWPVQWDNTGRNVYMKVEASGILRRLNQGASPLKSAIYREQTSPNRARRGIMAYWPLEDEDGALSMASAIPGAPAMAISGEPSLHSYTGWAASEPIPVMGETGQFRGIVPTYSLTGESTFRMFIHVQAAVAAKETLFKVEYAGGSLDYSVIELEPDGDLTLTTYKVDGSAVTTGSQPFDMNNMGTGVIVFELTQVGADAKILVLTQTFTATDTVDDFIPGGFSILATYSSETFGRIRSITIGGTGGLTQVAVGHATVGNDTGVFANTGDALRAYNGEDPQERFARLCNEHSISYVAVNDPDFTTNDVDMGPQGTKTLLELLSEISAADLGLMFEPRDQFGLGYRQRNTLYNQDPKLVLNYANHQLAESLAPVDDDQTVSNDITVSRSSGSKYRIVQEEGPLSVQPPPDGVGRYDDSVTINVVNDEQLAQQAGWRLFLGTLDAARYPEIQLNLRHESFLSDLDLMNAAMTFDVGDRIVIEDVPSFLPPDDIDLLVQGYTETFDQFEHTMKVNCSPASPYEVGITDDGVRGRADTAGCALVNAIDSTTTLIDVTTTEGPLWTEDGAEYPFDLLIGGEVMTALLCSGGGINPQTFTVTRSVNGIVKSHPAGTDVRLAQPTVPGL